MILLLLIIITTVSNNNDEEKADKSKRLIVEALYLGLEDLKESKV